MSYHRREREDDEKLCVHQVETRDCAKCGDMALLPLMSCEEAMTKFNVAFGTNHNPQQKRTYIDLLNLSTHAHAHGENHLAAVLYRYAEAATDLA